MSAENVELVRSGYEHFARTLTPLEDVLHPDFVWNMATFRGWPEQQVYEGVEGLRAFLADWGDVFDEWAVELRSIHDAGDQVVGVVHQHGRSKLSGLLVEMDLAQVWTISDGLEIRMDMYNDRDDAMRAAGLAQ